MGLALSTLMPREECVTFWLFDGRCRPSDGGKRDVGGDVTFARHVEIRAVEAATLSPTGRPPLAPLQPQVSHCGGCMDHHPPEEIAADAMPCLAVLVAVAVVLAAAPPIGQLRRVLVNISRSLVPGPAERPGIDPGPVNWGPPHCDRRAIGDRTGPETSVFPGEPTAPQLWGTTTPRQIALHASPAGGLACSRFRGVCASARFRRVHDPGKAPHGRDSRRPAEVGQTVHFPGPSGSRFALPCSRALSGQDPSSPRFTQDETGQGRAGQDGTGQDRTGRDRTGQAGHCAPAYLDGRTVARPPRARLGQSVWKCQ
jgi:hypothetical protein